MGFSIRPIPATALLVVLLFVTRVAGWNGALGSATATEEKKLDQSETKNVKNAHDAHARHHSGGTGSVIEKGVNEQLTYVRGQLTAFLKARDEFATMQEQVKDRFKSDENEIDRLVERQHHIKEDQKDAKSELDAIAHQESLLQAEAKIYAGQKNKTKEAAYVKQQVLDLQELAATIQGSAAELDEDQKTIDQITREGKTLDAELQKRNREQATIEAQLKVLEKQQSRLEEKAEYGEEERTNGEAQGILDDEDGATADYEAESAQALEHALGWNQDKLEEQATNAEDALRKGIGGGNMMRNIGSMMGAMHAMR